MGRIIYLIGMMGAGKTTVGRMLAERLGWDCVDMDQQIEKEQGKSIPAIFAESGEEGFRRLETELLGRLSAGECLRVSTGGGTPLREENRRIMASSGLVVYLRVSVEDVLRRTRGDRHRPMLAGTDRRKRVEELLEMRHPLYCAAADISFQSSSGAPGVMAARIAGHPKVRGMIARDGKEV